ncbi:uncharacterized protein LOC123536528 [Mercenaria mercenaria]|uniref:uncharacterized protein LOC123536528 n=1 Tax=Mercenaria mercenaria TaxID=6596 RepID=UPI00234ED0F9|nr:uncharacterized protein LOC123536528 [Mercenaria mercenaria]
MDKQWKHLLLSILLVTSNICQIVGQNYDESTDFDEFELPGAEGYTDNLQKRLSKFVRIGRGLSSFIRIGRQVPFEELDFYQSADIPHAIDNENGDTDNSAFFELEPENINKPSKRLSSFVRIGRNYNGGNVLPENDVNKRAAAFIRMGKFPTSAFLRNRPGRVDGYNSQPYYRRTGRIGHSSFIRIGKRDTSDALRRMSENENQYENGDLIQQLKNAQSDDEIESILKTDNSRYLKIGRDVEDESIEKGINETDNKRYLKIGRDVEDESSEKDTEISSLAAAQDDKTVESLDKRLSNFVRIGKGGPSPIEYPYNWPDTQQQKRLSNFVRIGRNSDNLDKRISSFVRIGRGRNLADDIAKRRVSSFVRIGKKSKTIDPNTEQRTRPLVGTLKSTDFNNGNKAKRISSFVRIGKNPEQLDNEMNKRYSSFVRIGKSGNSLENDLAKRYSSFVRIGRNYPQSENEYNKRLSSFIRVGKNNPGTDNEYNKRYSSFVRIGKDSPSIIDNAAKRYSSFVRIGKNSDDFDPSYDKRLSSFIRVGKEMNGMRNYPEDTQSGDSYKDQTRKIEKRAASTEQINKKVNM